MPIPFYHPRPRPTAEFKDSPLPLGTANVFSKALFLWVGPILRVGYSRPIQPDGECLGIGIKRSVADGSRSMDVDGRSVVPKCKFRRFLLQILYAFPRGTHQLLLRFADIGLPFDSNLLHNLIWISEHLLLWSGWSTHCRS
jgi:hypothetical protein